MEKNKLSKNKQPIKAITQQDIHKLNETLEKLQSWTSTLNMLDKFFKYEKEPLNKKKVIQEYYADSKIFTVFFEDFLTQTNLLKNQLEELQKREKIRN